METSLPEFLYRGDNDSHNTRDLRKYLKMNFLASNLINGGNGREITERPILDLITKHISPGWDLTHFLSFTECEKIAKRFCLHCELNELEDKWDYHRECYDDDWKFIIARIDLKAEDITITLKEKGFYLVEYNASTLQFSPKAKFLMIDVVTFLKNKGYAGQSLANAIRDKEWLILPANPFQKGQLSAFMDLGSLDVIKYTDKGLSDIGIFAWDPEN